MIDILIWATRANSLILHSWPSVKRVSSCEHFHHLEPPPGWLVAPCQEQESRAVVKRTCSVWLTSLTSPPLTPDTEDLHQEDDDNTQLFVTNIVKSLSLGQFPLQYPDGNDQLGGHYRVEDILHVEIKLILTQSSLPRTLNRFPLKVSVVTIIWRSWLTPFTFPLLALAPDTEDLHQEDDSGQHPDIWQTLRRLCLMVNFLSNIKLAMISREAN